ncbi:putative phd finger and set domain protein [Lasiodiplodia theobromae]|uniref:Phd finger and set domain protein n=1 Tax=Lasiodiplodia theobromae TaxID=45133 RepID=A0A8H7MB01_9PEZI|nr:putative phd finger and set domain protein [Lasiodiplodia theobromae]
MVCGFCPSSGSMAEKSFNRVDVFKRHLTSVHDVEQTPPNSRKKNAAANKVYNGIKTAGNCSICSVTFANAQDFYEHLNDCVLKVVQKASEPAEYTYPGPTDPAAESTSPFLQPIKIGSTPPPYPPPLSPQHSAPVITQTVSPTTSSSRRRKRNNRTRPSQGDTVLLSFLDPKRPDIVRAAGERALNSDSDPEPSDSEDDTPGSPMQTDNETTATVLLAEATPKRFSSGEHSIASKPKLAPLRAIAEPKPEPRKTRTWTDRTGSFKVEAEFMGLKDGKINLHKLNGVDITVSIPKMSVEDLEYVEKVAGVSLDKEKALELVSEDRKEPITSPQTPAVHQLNPSASFAPVSNPFPDGQPVADAPQPDEEPTSEIMKCACGYQTGDGTCVQCEVCRKWQHVLCYYDNEEQIPQNHECVACQPRTLDRARIKERQKVFKNMAYMSEKESKPPGLKSPKKKEKDLGAAIAPTNENVSPASEGHDSSNDDSATQPSRGRESIHNSSSHAMPGLDLNKVEFIPLDHDS